MNFGSSKSAKIILLKSFVYVKKKNFQKKSIKNINIGDYFL